MRLKMNIFIQEIIVFLFLLGLLPAHAFVHHHRFIINEAPYSKLCSSKNILTVNGQFPGPVIYANTGDTLVVNVQNDGTQNITIHWHGVKQPRYPWSDGPEFITQCPIRPGTNFSQRINLSDEEGTLWWHAHSDWSRATVNGALIIRPANKTNYPFPRPAAEIPIILGEWWKSDVQAVVNEFLASGGDANKSDAFLINGQPGDLYPCSTNDTFKLTVEKDKTYMLRIVNAVMNNLMFFSVANHQLTVVGTDGAYVKPFKSNYITISPGETIDVLLEANQNPNHYYMGAKAYNSVVGVEFDNTTTTAIIQYSGNYTASSPPILPDLPNFDDTNASFNFTRSLKSLADKTHPINVPLNITTNLLFTFSVNTLPCEDESCGGPNGDRFAASVNNISFVLPRIDILEAYYKNIQGVYGDEFPSFPPLNFNFTGGSLPVELQRPDRRTEVHVLEYGTNVEIVLQGTSLLGGVDHPIHLHGYSFYVVGAGFGNFDKDKDPLNYNLVDPPLQNTIAVVRNGWAAIRFKADNPGVWFMHCHLERHVSWGMEMAFIVKDGKGSQEKLLPPPPDMPLC
ncbi:laccase-14-like [Solanum stenotomum]|uniref:laccase-14-like n=1 Tax=Solanum stenotomum TaxID=172797 RepID=UPI0020D1E472|nr:laccase-14-like [Solanum stenotomum]